MSFLSNELNSNENFILFNKGVEVKRALNNKRGDLKLRYSTRISSFTNIHGSHHNNVNQILTLLLVFFFWKIN